MSEVPPNQAGEWHQPVDCMWKAQQEAMNKYNGLSEPYLLLSHYSLTHYNLKKLQLFEWKMHCEINNCNNKSDIMVNSFMETLNHIGQVYMYTSLTRKNKV